MKPANLISPLFLTLCLLCSSCAVDYVPNAQLSDRELVIIAELEVDKPGLDVEISVSTTYSKDEEPIFPTTEDGEIRISNVSSGQRDVELRYNKTKGQFFFDAFKFDGGDELSIATKFDKLGLDPIYASTTVPQSGKFVKINDGILDNSDPSTFKIHTSIELSELEKDTYYHLIPYTTNNPLHFDKNHLNVEETGASGATLFDLSHTGGILIDYSKASDKLLDLELSTSSNLSFNPSHVYLLLKTVTKDYYDYHKSLTVQQETKQGPFDAPTPTFSNIERGQGIFVAYTTTLDSLLVK